MGRGKDNRAKGKGQRAKGEGQESLNFPFALCPFALCPLFYFFFYFFFSSTPNCFSMAAMSSAEVASRLLTSLSIAEIFPVLSM